MNFSGPLHIPADVLQEEKHRYKSNRRLGGPRGLSKSLFGGGGFIAPARNRTPDHTVSNLAATSIRIII